MQCFKAAMKKTDKMDKGATSLTDISNCLLLHICSYLDSTSLYQLSRVNTYLASFVEEVTLWRRIDARQEPNTEDKINYCLARTHDKTELFCIRSPRFEQSDFPRYFTALAHTPVNLTVLALENQFITCDPLSLSTFPSTLKELSFRKSSFIQSDEFFKKSCKAMTNLRVLLLDECRNIDSSVLMSISKFSNLEIVSLFKCPIDTSVAYFSIAGWHGFQKLKVLDARLSGLGNIFLKSLQKSTNIIAMYYQNMDSTYARDFNRRQDDIVQSNGSEVVPNVKHLFVGSDMQDAGTVITDFGTADFMRRESDDLVHEYPVSYLYKDPYPICKCGYVENMGNWHVSKRKQAYKSVGKRRPRSSSSSDEDDDNDHPGNGGPRVRNYLVEKTADNILESSSGNVFSMEKEVKIKRKCKSKESEQPIKKIRIECTLGIHPPPAPNQPLPEDARASLLRANLVKRRLEALNKKRGYFLQVCRERRQRITMGPAAGDQTVNGNWEDVEYSQEDIEKHSENYRPSSKPSTSAAARAALHDDPPARPNEEKKIHYMMGGSDAILTCTKINGSVSVTRNLEMEQAQAQVANGAPNVPNNPAGGNPQPVNPEPPQPLVVFQAVEGGRETTRSVACQTKRFREVPKYKDEGCQTLPDPEYPSALPNAPPVSEEPSTSDEPSTSGTARPKTPEVPYIEIDDDSDDEQQSLYVPTSDVIVVEMNWEAPTCSTPPIEEEPVSGTSKSADGLLVSVGSQVELDREEAAGQEANNENFGNIGGMLRGDKGCQVYFIEECMPKRNNAARALNADFDPGDDYPELRIFRLDEEAKSQKISLKNLSLRGYPRVTNASLRSLQHLKLDLLDITYTNTTKLAIENFLQYNPNCRVVHKDFCVCLPRIHF